MELGNAGTMGRRRCATTRRRRCACCVRSTTCGASTRSSSASSSTRCSRRRSSSAAPSPTGSSRATWPKSSRAPSSGRSSISGPTSTTSTVSYWSFPSIASISYRITGPHWSCFTGYRPKLPGFRYFDRISSSYVFLRPNLTERFYDRIYRAYPDFFSGIHLVFSFHFPWFVQPTSTEIRPDS